MEFFNLSFFPFFGAVGCSEGLQKNLDMSDQQQHSMMVSIGAGLAYEDSGIVNIHALGGRLNTRLSFPRFPSLGKIQASARIGRWHWHCTFNCIHSNWLFTRFCLNISQEE